MKKTLLKIILYILILITLSIVYAKYIGIKGLKVKEYRVESNILTENFSGLKIVHFSDLYYKSTVNDQDVENLIEKINILRPDIVVFTGDLVKKGTKISDKEQKFLIKALSSIKTTIGKYAIYGDQDYSLSNYHDIIEKSNFKILNNSYETIYYKSISPMYLVGLPSSIKEPIKLKESFEFYSDEDRKYTIVLVHDGKTIKYLDESTYEVDMILGGHSLNGSVVLPGIGGIFIEDSSYKYYGEYYEKGITNIYISSGIGTNNYNYRFNNKPSFNLYRLKAQS